MGVQEVEAMMSKSNDNDHLIVTASIYTLKMQQDMIIFCCLLFLTANHHTMHQCMPLTLSNNTITIRVRKSGSHFLVGIQYKNRLNADIVNADISEINPCRHSVRSRHSVR